MQSIFHALQRRLYSFAALLDGSYGIQVLTVEHNGKSATPRLALESIHVVVDILNEIVGFIFSASRDECGDQNAGDGGVHAGAHERNPYARSQQRIDQGMLNP